MLRFIPKITLRGLDSHRVILRQENERSQIKRKFKMKKSMVYSLKTLEGVYKNVDRHNLLYCSIIAQKHKVFYSCGKIP